LAVEAAELLEVFQWLTEEQSYAMASSPEDLELVRQELADVVIYAVRLADKFGIDVPAAVEAKLAINEAKYPVILARDNAIKYSRRPP